MGKPLMIQAGDDSRIEQLKRRLGVRTKVDVVRAGLDLLEQEAERRGRIARWRRSVRLARATSREVNTEFRPHARFKKL